MNIVVLIPSLNPDETLLTVVENIRAQGFGRFVIVDDGSRAESQHIFETLAGRGCDVARHAVNLGKGRALKTGFNYILNHLPDAEGVVTCDADGQHEPAAIRATAEAVLTHPNEMILAVRRFFEARVPWRNLAGNTITRGMFYLLTGQRFGDTQCGLRGIPRALLAQMMAVAGERFEYENVMLLALRSRCIPYAELAVRAVYAPEGQPSHFNKVLDSIRIYRHLLSFAALPAACGLLALLLYRGLAAHFLPEAMAALAILLGWGALWLTGPAKSKGAALALTVVHGAACTALVWLFHTFAGMTAVGAWWLAAVLCLPSGYSGWLNCRFGLRPVRSKLL